MRQWRIGAAPAGAEIDDVIDDVAASLRGGGIVLLPTDTIYGLHAVATDANAIDRLARIKGRDDLKPFVVVAADAGQLEEIGIAFPPDVLDLLTSVWPAPLTAVLPLRRPIAASRGTAALAVRVPNVPWLRELLARTGPLASTSANVSGEPPISEPGQLAAAVRSRLDGIVDAGPLAGEPSTIVDFTGDEPRLIREGSAFAQEVWKTLRKNL
jgi:L-threonylcarbamoyladenylate synthase